MTSQVAICPICDSQINLAPGTETTEIINCSECKGRLVVEKISHNEIILNQAPEVAEDWGE